MRRISAAIRRWREARQETALARHQQAIAAQYAPRLSAYRQIVEQATVKAQEHKVVPFLNLQLVRDKRRRVA